MLTTILSPKSIALIGASRTPGKLGFEILNNLVRLGYQGKIFPVNPTSTIILNQKTYPNVSKIPIVVDLAIICIPAQYVLDIATECGKKGIKGLVVISAGFKETGSEGEKREQKLKKIAKKYNMRIIGPNCLGLINTALNLNGSFAEGLPKAGNISLISQSGAMAVAITDWAYEINLGFHIIVSLGNKADLSEIDFLKYLEKDKKTDVILLYLESIEDGREFMKIARQVSLKKPIIMVKAGVSESGSKAVASHTGSLAGSNSAIKAALKQSGIIRAESIEEMFNLARIFSCQPTPKGNKVAIITNAGGPGVMTTDSIEKTDLKLAKFTPETTTNLKENLPASATIQNPIDIVGDALADRYKIALDCVFNDSNVDIIIALLTPQIMTEKERTTNLLIALHQKYPHKPLVTCFIGGKNITYAVSRLQDYCIPNFYPERAIQVLNKMYNFKLWQNKTKKINNKETHLYKPSHFKNLHQEIVIEKKQGLTQLSQSLTTKLLKKYHIHFPQIEIAKNTEQVIKLSTKIGYPVALKIISPEVIHKTEAGGVRIDLKNETETKNAFKEIIKNVKKHHPKAKINGILVQKMYTFGREVIIGMKRDASFGPLIMFGLGGIYVEIMKDVSFRVAPVNFDEALDMIHEVRAIQLLKGVRGEAPADIQKIAETILAISQLSLNFPEIKELDINPLLVQSEGHGAVALDTRFIV